MFQRLFHLSMVVLRPALLGVATVVLPKARLDDHWSTSPTLVMTFEADSPGSGDPPSPGAKKGPRRRGAASPA